MQSGRVTIAYSVLAVLSCCVVGCTRVDNQYIVGDCVTKPEQLLPDVQLPDDTSVTWRYEMPGDDRIAQITVLSTTVNPPEMADFYAASAASDSVWQPLRSGGDGLVEWRQLAFADRCNVSWGLRVSVSRTSNGAPTIVEIDVFNETALSVTRESVATP